MRVLTIEEMALVSGGHYTDKDGTTHLDTISVGGDRARSDSAGDGRSLGKKVGPGRWQNGTVTITRVLEAKTGQIHWVVFDKSKHIFNEADERTLMQRLTNEFGFRFFGGQREQGGGDSGGRGNH